MKLREIKINTWTIWILVLRVWIIVRNSRPEHILLHLQIEKVNEQSQNCSIFCWFKKMISIYHLLKSNSVNHFFPCRWLICYLSSFNASTSLSARQFMTCPSSTPICPRSTLFGPRVRSVSKHTLMV